MSPEIRMFGRFNCSVHLNSAFVFLVTLSFSFIIMSVTYSFSVLTEGVAEGGGEGRQTKLIVEIISYKIEK